MRRMLAHCAITSETRILDVGGLPEFWESLTVQPFLVLLNVIAPEGHVRPGTHAIVADGKLLPFRDGAFDLVVSNSAIEHVGNRHSQELFAREVMRVGKSYWVQTPNRWFPLEQHLFIPLLHWLPKSWQSPVIRRFTLWSFMPVSKGFRDSYVNHYLADIRLLWESELRHLFPTARIFRESFFGITKSLIAIGKR